MRKLITGLSQLTGRNVKVIFDYDLKVCGFVDYVYFDNFGRLNSATYRINNESNLGILTGANYDK